MSLGAKDYFNRLLTIDRDILKRCTLELPQFKQRLINVIHGIIVELEHHTPLSVPIDDLFGATRVVLDVGNTCIRLNWLDNATKKIYEGRELQLRLQKLSSLKINVKDEELFLHQS